MRSEYRAVPARRPKAWDDYWPETRETLDVIVTDDDPVETGLIDQHGNKIVRLSPRQTMGFCR